MKILDRYIAGIIIQYTLLTMSVMIGLFTFINFIEQTTEIGRGNYDLWEAVKFVLLTIPRIIYEIFPMCAMLGTSIGLSMLANDSELIVMRASGISMLRITASALKVGALFVLCSIIFGEIISPKTETIAQRGKAEAQERNLKKQTNFGLWMRDNNTFVNIGEILPDLTLLGLKVFEFDQEKKLRSLVYAKEGHFIDNNADNKPYWQIHSVEQTIINEDGLGSASMLEEGKWYSKVTPQILSTFLVKPDQLPVWQLNDYIAHLKANQQKTDSYELAFWSKLMLPLATAVMVILAIPFVFSNLRSGNLGRNIFIGIMIGLGFFVINKGFGYVVLAYGLSPFTGAVAPVLAFFLLAIFLIQRVE